MTEPHDPHGEPPPSREEGLAHLDERLAWARADIEQRDRLTQRAEHTRRHLVMLTARVGKLQTRTESERRDVDDVTGPTVVALLEQLVATVRQGLALLFAIRPRLLRRVHRLVLGSSGTGECGRSEQGSAGG